MHQRERCVRAVQKDPESPLHSHVCFCDSCFQSCSSQAANRIQEPRTLKHCRENKGHYRTCRYIRMPLAHPPCSVCIELNGLPYGWMLLPALSVKGEPFLSVAPRWERFLPTSADGPSKTDRKIYRPIYTGTIWNHQKVVLEDDLPLGPL